VKLFFDENFGSRIPEALQKLSAPCEAIDRPRRGGPIELGTSDIDWLVAVGRDGFLGLSEDVAILRSSVERAALVDAGAGVVFFKTGGSTRWEAFRLLLRTWDWLGQIDRETQRPFAFVVSRSGRKQRIPLP
jgi:hypothetical protein